MRASSAANSERNIIYYLLRLQWMINGRWHQIPNHIRTCQMPGQSNRLCNQFDFDFLFLSNETDYYQFVSTYRITGDLTTKMWSGDSIAAMKRRRKMEHPVEYGVLWCRRVHKRENLRCPHGTHTHTVSAFVEDCDCRLYITHSYPSWDPWRSEQIRGRHSSHRIFEKKDAKNES